MASGHQHGRADLSRQRHEQLVRRRSVADRLGGYTLLPSGVTTIGQISGVVQSRYDNTSAGIDNLSGITVDLLTTAGVVVATTTTSATGAYSFEQPAIAPGSYKIRFTDGRPSPPYPNKTEYFNDVTSVGAATTITFANWSVSAASSILQPNIPDAGFTDAVPATFEAASDWFLHLGIGTGFDDGNNGIEFRSSADVTRGQFAYWLHNALDTPTPGPATGCTDVASTHQFEDAITWIIPIVGCAGGSTFGWNTPLQRKMAVSWLYALASMGEAPDLTGLTEPFTDITNADGHYDAVRWAYHGGAADKIVAGVGNPPTSFDESGTISRGQAANWLYLRASYPWAWAGIGTLPSTVLFG